MNGTKRGAEAAGACKRTVGERRGCGEEGQAMTLGAAVSDYAGTSNDQPGENPGRRMPKVSWGRSVRPGLVGP
jgi:hypothetical protein